MWPWTPDIGPWQPWVIGTQIVFFLFFLGVNGYYTMLLAFAAPTIIRHMRRRDSVDAPQVDDGLAPGVTLIAPAYNEEATIAESVRSLLRIDYIDIEVVVVNDGSKDATLEVLQREFSLVPCPMVSAGDIPCAAVRQVFLSLDYPNLIVVDKENGGSKADAMNAGINFAQRPLFCCLDADSVLTPDAIRRTVQPFLEDPTVVAAGASIFLLNGCRIRPDRSLEIGLPKNKLALYQVLEYLRGFIYGRMGWVPMNAVMIVSGAFGVFNTELIRQIGGYRHTSLGEDMDLVLRIHKHNLLHQIPYRVAFIPDPVCWTEAPETVAVLRSQRIRWQRGLGDCLWESRQLFFNPKSKWVGWLAMPFMFVFEFLAPVLEFVGYLIFAICLIVGWTSMPVVIAFLTVALGFGLLISVVAILLHEATFGVYPGSRNLLKLMAAAVTSEFGYRQRLCWWRCIGMWRMLTRQKSTWGAMPRTATWTSAATSASTTSRPEPADDAQENRA